MLKIFLLRHVESQGNADGLIQGQYDSHLTDRGRQQALSLAAYWSKSGQRFDRLISSTLSRAMETANIIAEQLRVNPELDPDWMERCFGEIEGMAYNEIIQAYPEINFYHPFLAPALGAETVLDLYVRACRAVQKIGSFTEGSYLIVSHGAFLNMVMYVILGISPQTNHVNPRFLFDNTGYAELTYDPEKQLWRIWKHNRTDHIIPSPDGR